MKQSGAEVVDALPQRRAFLQENKNRPPDMVQFSRAQQLSMSLREQKESLPIYRLRSELMQAVRDN